MGNSKGGLFMNLSSQTTTGVLFIIAAIAPLVIYMGLGAEGGGVLDASLTEKLAVWVMFALPVAFMMTVDAMGGGSGHLAKKMFRSMFRQFPVCVPQKTH